MSIDNQFDAESKGDFSDRAQQINNSSSTELASSIWDGMRDDSRDSTGNNGILTIREGAADNDNSGFNLRTKEQVPGLLPQVDFYDFQSK